MSSLNKVQLIGNLGRDPEIKNLQGGDRMAIFSLATSESWKDRGTGERQERTEWHRVVVFSQGLVGVVERYCNKGDKVYVEGKLQTRKWDDSNGVTRYTTEVVLPKFGAVLLLLGSRGPRAGSSMANAEPRSEPDMDDDIPF